MNAIEYLNISVEEMTAEEVILTMPIRDEIKQPYGIVHGGMNALLAETAGSFGANIGLDIHTHHIAQATEGTLRAIATPIHAGRQIQTWRIDTYVMETNKLTSSSTFTAMIIPVRK